MPQLTLQPPAVSHRFHILRAQYSLKRGHHVLSQGVFVPADLDRASWSEEVPEFLAHLVICKEVLDVAGDRSHTAKAPAQSSAGSQVDLDS